MFNSIAASESTLKNSQIQVERCTKQTVSTAFPQVPAVRADTLLRVEEREQVSKRYFS